MPTPNELEVWQEHNTVSMYDFDLKLASFLK